MSELPSETTNQPGEIPTPEAASQPTPQSPSPQNTSPLFQGVAKYLIIASVVLVLVIVGELYLLFQQEKENENQPTPQAQVETGSTETSQQTAGEERHKSFVEQIKKNTIPQSPDKITTIRRDLIKVTEINQFDDLVISGEVETAKLGKINISLAYPKTIFGKITVWNFASGSRQQANLADLKVGNTVTIIEKINVEKQGYEDSIEAIIIEVF